MLWLLPHDDCKLLAVHLPVQQNMVVCCSACSALHTPPVVALSCSASCIMSRTIASMIKTSASSTVTLCTGAQVLPRQAQCAHEALATCGCCEIAGATEWLMRTLWSGVKGLADWLPMKNVRMLIPQIRTPEGELTSEGLLCLPACLPAFFLRVCQCLLLLCSSMRYLAASCNDVVCRFMSFALIAPVRHQAQHRLSPAAEPHTAGSTHS